MRGGQVPAPPVLGVLRFPRSPPRQRGRTGATTPAGDLVMTFDSSQRGKQVDVTGPTGEPLGRMVFTGRRRWVLVAPRTGAVQAEIDTRHQVQVSVDGGPWVRVRGRTEEWDLVWQDHPLLTARKVPRKQAKRCVDVWVFDATFTPPVVAFVLHVWRVWIAEQADNALVVQQLTAPPPASY